LLKEGYKQSGAPEKNVEAIDDRLLREFPQSEEACWVLEERWRKENKEPQDHSDTIAWSKYKKTYRDALQSWFRENKGDRRLADQYWFYAIKDEESLAEKDGIAAMEGYLRSTTEYSRPSSYDYYQAADFVVLHKWQPERALDLLKQAELLEAKE